VVRKQEIFDKIIAVVTTFSQPLDTSDTTLNWNEELRRKWLSIFFRLGGIVAKNEPIPQEFTSIPPNLDSSGITDSPAFNQASGVFDLVGQYKRTLRELKIHILIASAIEAVVVAFLILLPYLFNFDRSHHFWMRIGLVLFSVLIYWGWFSIILRKTLNLSGNSLTQLDSFRICVECKRKFGENERVLTIENELGGEEFLCVQCYAESK
jgi:hypothetical protein